MRRTMGIYASKALLGIPYVMAAVMFFSLGWAAHRDGFELSMILIALIGLGFMGWIEARVMHEIAKKDGG